LSITGRVLDLLAACMLRTVVVREPDEAAGWPLSGECAARGGESALEVLRRWFAWKNEHEPLEWRADGPADLEIVGEWGFGAPAVIVDAAARTVRMRLPPGDRFAHLDLSCHVAREVRDVLLGRKLLQDSSTFFGGGGWPFAQAPREVAGSRRAPLPVAGKHVMVVGCGSVGSGVARTLRDLAARWTLVDGSPVSAFNPSRQWFGLGEVGMLKVEALAERLAPAPVCAISQSLGVKDTGLLERLLAEDRPDVVVLATGTRDDAAIAPTLWSAGVPHVVAYAYPQARFFEVTTVLPEEHTPCAHCFRGHLYRGVESQAPIPDEVASFLYSRPEASDRDRLYVDLVAEPATKIETSRIADVVSRCAVEAMLEPGRRSAWMARMLAEGTTCLLGANAVERREDGRLAYGMTHAGQVVRLGLSDVAGAEERITCESCGRRMDVVHRTELPEGDEAAVDLGLLGALEPGLP
jgi:hypothetical protein